MATTVAPESEIDGLQAKCIQALKEERKVELQLEDLRTQLKRLRRRGKALDVSSGVKQADTTDAFAAFAKAVCMEFCNKVYQTFPREICDNIYGHLKAQDAVTITKRTRKGTRHQKPPVAYFDTSSEAQMRLCSMKAETDHWWRADFVGADMVREIGENYFRSTCFDFEDQFNIISKFRVTDQWKLGFLPVSFVSIVEVTIDCAFDDFKDYDGCITFYETEDIHSHSVDDPWQPGNGWNSPRPLRTHRTSLLIQLESLFGFKSGCSLNIRLRTSEYIFEGWLGSQEWMCNTVVPLIFPTVQRLKAAGYRVQITLGEGQGGRPFPIPFTSSYTHESYGAFKTEFEKYEVEEQKRIENLLDLEEASVWEGEE